MGLTMTATEASSQLLKHGEKFKFMSIQMGRSDDHFPRIIPIAGEYPGVTLEEVMAPFSNEPVVPGTWSYDFTDADDPGMGRFACPPSQVMSDAEDPVGLITTNSALGIRVDAGKDLECVVVVDRGDLKYDPDCFYLWTTDRGTLEIGASDVIPSGWRIEGRIVITTVPWDPSMEKAATGWLEEE